MTSGNAHIPTFTVLDLRYFVGENAEVVIWNIQTGEDSGSLHYHTLDKCLQYHGYQKEAETGFLLCQWLIHIWVHIRNSVSL